jgi:hypothetical protein
MNSKHPDLRDERGRTTPGLWPKSSGTPEIARPCPAGGKVDPNLYHRRGHFTDMAETQPMPLRNK